MSPYARIACALGLSAALYAHGAAPQGSQQPADAAGAGQQIAMKGGSGAAPCSSCHGQQGEGNAASGFPRLAGQSGDYLAHQLDSYANGSRKNPVMEPIAKALNAEQRKAVSAYYEQLSPGGKAASRSSTSGKSPSAPPLATVGDNKRRVQGCVNCHGPGGIGEPPEYPYLASQHASYLASALREWKTGARNNDPTGQMPSIAKALSDADIKTLSDYYARLPAPPSARELLSMKPAAPRPAAPADSAAGPKQATPTSGTGVEPGTPTQGGAQGPGGAGGASGSGPQGSKR
jgi:cytochrome c553